MTWRINPYRCVHCGCDEPILGIDNKLYCDNCGMCLEPTLPSHTQASKLEGGLTIAEKDKEFRLCYVHENVMWFTDNFDGQWGDDWNDITYSGSDTPYVWCDEETEEWNLEHHHGHMLYIGFYSEHEDLRPPFDQGRYCIADVNKKAVAWLYSDDAGGLMAGSTIAEAISWCRKAKVKFGELTE